MQFLMNIIEFPTLFSYREIKDNFLLYDHICVYSINDFQVVKVSYTNPSDIFTITDDGIWLKKREDDVIDIHCEDVFNKNRENEFIENVGHSGDFRKGLLAYRKTIKDEYTEWQSINVINIENNKRIKIEFNEREIFYKKLVLDTNIYVKSSDQVGVRVGDTLHCLSYNLEEIWKFKLPDNLVTNYRSMPDHYTGPLICNDKVIINAGVDRKTDKDGKVFALDKVSGKLCWEYDIQSQISSIYIVDNKIYITHEGDIIVLDEEGKTLIQEPSGFEDMIIAYPFKDKLLCISDPENKLRIFSGDAKEMIADIDFPEAYSPSSVHPVYEIDGTFYMPVFGRKKSLFEAKNVSGVLAVREDPDGDNQILIQPRIPVDVGTETIDGEKVYVVTVENENFDDLLRFGEINVREVACKTGFNPYYDNPDRDKKHKGRIIFRVNLEDHGGDALEIVQKMADSASEQLNSFFIWAGASTQKNHIKFNIQVEVIE